jgi:CHAD domain-containing protein
LQELYEQVLHEPKGKAAGLDFLTGFSLGQRAAARAALTAANNNFPESFDQLAGNVLKAVRSAEDGPDTLIELAQPVLRGFLRALEHAACRNLENYDNLHQVRIAGKRLRYAMEYFGYCYPPSLRETYYPAVEEMQEILGRANDSHVAGRRLGALAEMLRAVHPAAWKQYRDRIDELRAIHKERLPALRLQFESWWQRWRQEGGQDAVMVLLGGVGPVRSD